MLPDHLLLPLLVVLAGGALAGLLAGMLGVGGGIVLVPLLVAALALAGVDGNLLMQLAIATSLASIPFTGLGSVRAHHRRGAVRWPLVRRMAPALVAGALLGSVLADRLGSLWLMRLFGVFAALVGLQMLLARTPAADAAPERAIPPLQAVVAGGVIGVASAVFGIGGGSLTVPWLHRFRVRMQEAVATSSACGIPIAVAGSAGFIFHGWQQPGLPAGALGYVHLPFLLAIVLASVPLAGVGARVAHRLPAATLRRLFGLVLLLVAADFLRAA